MAKTPTAKLVEVWYCWKEYKVVEDAEEDGPRFLTPWADPYKYETPFDFVYRTPEDAIQMKEELAPEEDWILVKMTLEEVQR